MTKREKYKSRKETPVFGGNINNNPYRYEDKADEDYYKSFERHQHQGDA